VKVYRMVIAPERAPKVYRVYELSARHTLYDVHGVIQREFGLDGNHSHVFYMSGRHWDKASEVEGPDTWGGRGRTPRTRLYELALEVGRQFAYVFDLRAELWHQLVVQAVLDSDEPPAEPRLVESVGEAPPRHGASEQTKESADEAAALSSLLPLANELVALFPPVSAADDAEAGLDGEGQGEEDEPDADCALDLEPEALRSALAIATRLAPLLEGKAERLSRLSDLTRRDLRFMLADLPMALARAEWVDEGAALALALSFIDPAHYLGDRAILLAEASRQAEALDQVTYNLESVTGDAWVQIKAAEVYALLDDPGRAEALLRAALAQPTDDATHDSAVDALLELLDRQGRSAEGKALLAAERARLDALVKARSETVQHATPKVGRNDPCPCGSGKKHKKCCWA
jgi:hypothetical protein